MQTNVLYYGDNLDILRRHLPDACGRALSSIDAWIVLGLAATREPAD